MNETYEHGHTRRELLERVALAAAGTAVVGWTARGDALAAMLDADLGEVVFSRRSGTNTAHISTIRADGRGFKRITSGAYDYDPAWSPDGTRIAFASDRGHDVPNVYVMDADGKNVVRLTDSSGRGGSYAPTWSPDGTQIAFARSDGAANENIYVIGADGTGLRRLTASRARDTSPAWSPVPLPESEETQIAFVSDRTGQPEIYIMRTDGSREYRLTGKWGSRSTGFWAPAWSPDARWLALAGTGGIFLFSIGTGVAKKLRGTRGGDSEPAWAPDGKTIVFAGGNRGAGTALYTIRSDGSGLRRLTRPRPLRHDVSPAWRPTR